MRPVFGHGRVSGCWGRYGSRVFTDMVWEKIVRLGGQLPAGFAPREWVVDTPAGKRRVPDWAQALYAVVFTTGDLRDDFLQQLVSFHHYDIEPSYFEEAGACAWHGIGERGDYCWYVADFDDTSADPIVYTLDKEGGNDGWIDAGIPLSMRLASLKVIAPPGDGDRLAVACSAGDVTAAAEELARGAGLGPLDDTGITPLHLAAMSRSTDMVRLLLEAGADARAAIAYDTKTPWTYLDPDTYTSGELWRGTTALHLALDNGGLRPRKYTEKGPVDEIVRLLLDAGADPDAIDSVGWTPMLISTDRPQIVEFMLAAGADPNVTGALRPPLVWVASRGESTGEEVVRLLLAAGADVNGAGGDGTALFAAGTGPTMIFQLLLDAGADPNQPNPPDCWSPGHTPLHRALRHPANLKLLLAAGADPNTRTPDGFTPLIEAMLHFHPRDPVEVVTSLVQAGAEADAPAEEVALQAYVAKQYKPKEPLASLTATTPTGIAEHLGMTCTAAYLAGHGTGA